MSTAVEPAGDESLPSALPVVSTPRSWPYWEALRERRRLELLRCDVCGHWVHYPKGRCSECWSRSLSLQPVSGAGRIVGWTRSYRATAPQIAELVPFTLVTVELVEQRALRVVVWLRGDELPHVDDQVRLEVVTSGDVVLPVAVPA